MNLLRYCTFWAIDFLRGSPIRKHYIEVKYIFSNWRDSNKLREKRLSDILHNATINSPYYKSFNPEVLQSFPVISKQDISENMDSIFFRELDDIPLEPSGKRKYIVSRLNQAISNWTCIFQKAVRFSNWLIEPIE